MVDTTGSDVRSVNFSSFNTVGAGSNFTALSISAVFLVGVLVLASFQFANTDTGLLVIGAAVGAIFGVGFYRECRAHSKRSKSAARSAAAESRAVSGQQVEQLKLLGDFNLKRRVLVRRVHLLTIVTAWLVTVPVAALLAASILLGLQIAMAG